MNKKTLLGSAVAVALTSAPVFAEDFHALSVLQSTPAQMQDSELATTEGGQVCDVTTANSTTGGVALCAWLVSGASGGTASFTVSNFLPVTGAQFLQVVN